MAILTFLKALLYPFILIATTITKFFWPDYPDDNPIEETIEYVIDIETGQKIDLTPDSPERLIDGRTIEEDYYGNK